MITVSLSNIIKNTLLRYAENELHQGHWGNGELMIPEHQILTERIKGASKKIELSLLQMEILCQWISGTTKDGRILTPEDRIVIQSLRNPLRKYYKKIKSSNTTEAQSALEQIKLLDKIYPPVLKKIIKKEKTDE
jgi:hypothetical protein